MFLDILKAFLVGGVFCAIGQFFIDYTKLTPARILTGFVVAGVEDYGIFCVEALSCGTPVLAYKGGGSVELIKENITGIFFDDWEVEDFKKALDRFENKKWDYMEVAKNLINMNSKEEFKKEIEKILVE